MKITSRLKIWLGGTIALGVIALMTGFVLPVTAATATPAKKAPPPVVEGTVRYDKKPVDHAGVGLYVEPPPDKLKKENRKKATDLTKIVAIPIKRIGVAITGKSGRFAIAVAGKNLATAEKYSFAFRKSRVVDLMVVAAWYNKKYGYDFDSERWFVRLYLPAGLRASAMPGTPQAADLAGTFLAATTAAAADAPTVMNLTVGYHVLPKILQPAYQALVRAEAAKGYGPACCQLPLSALDHCGQEDSLGQGYLGQGPYPSTVGNPLAWTDIGETYSNMSPVTMGFYYGFGQQSELDVGLEFPVGQGYQGPGGYLGGYFDAGYQISVSSDISMPYKNSKNYVNTNYQTLFQYQAYDNACGNGEILPNNFVGSQRYQHITSPDIEADGTCVWYPGPGPYGFGNSKAGTFTLGVNISFVIGVDLASQTGYDNAAQSSYYLPKGGYLCGTTGPAGGGHQGLVFAGKFNVHKYKRVRAR
jgi:hypothetical protein